MIFRRAIVRLTVMYTVVQLLLFGVFALAVYQFVTGTFDFDIADEEGPDAAHIAELGFAALRRGLLIGGAVLVVVVPCISYLMARAALRPVRQSYELQQRFVDAVSHELRTPLTVVQAELELALTRSREPDEYREAISGSLEALEGLTRLTDDLLLLTQAAPGGLESSFRPVPIAQVVRDAVRSRSGGHPVTVKLGLPFFVQGSPELLTRAVGNVVENAVKYSPEGTPIEVSTATPGSTGVVIVHDDGPGMKAGEVRHAFDRFWRAESARSSPGHGLGLSLVRHICEAHGGSVSLESEPGRGTTVTLTFPLAPDAPAPRAVAEPRAEHRA